MADEGNKSDGQESADVSLDQMIEQQVAEANAEKPPPESYGDWRAELKAHEGWLQAIAKDERSAAARNRVQDSPHSQRSWQSRKASYRAYVDTRKTEQGWARKVRAIWEPPRPSEPYAKGLDYSVGRLWDKFWTAAWRILGIE